MNIELKARRYAKERIPDVLPFERDLHSEENGGIGFMRRSRWVICSAGFRNKKARKEQSVMKKRLAGFLLVVVLLLSLCACTAEKAVIQADDNTFLVRFCMECEVDVFSIHFEYYLDGQPAGGGLAGNVDGAVLKYGEVLTKEFIPADFPEGGDLSGFQIEIFALDGQGQEYICNGLLSFSAAYGNVYDISIRGGYNTGFTAEKRAP